MQFINDAIDYFHYLCTQHPLLAHADTVGSRVFEVRDLEDAFGALRTGMKEKTYAVRLVLPSVKYRTEANGARKSYQFGLLVAKYHGRRETADSDVTDAMADSERVAEDFLERMVSDSRNGHPLFGYSADQVDNMEVTAEFLPMLFDGSYSGIMMLFQFEPYRKINSQACDPIAWVDGGLTSLLD